MRRVFDVYTQKAVPVNHETLLGLLDERGQLRDERDEAIRQRDEYRELLREVYGTHGKTERPGYVRVSEDLIVRIIAALAAHTAHER